MFEMGAETMGLPLAEKMEFEQGDDGQSPGYKAAGFTMTDEYGSLDTIEFLNVSKDDALAYPSVIHRTYPSTVNARMNSTIKPFVEKSLEINYTFLSIFEKKLALPPGALLGRHSIEDISGSEARCLRSPLNRDPQAKDKVALGAHTDFGSLSFLHNRLGGLQVFPPGVETWQYVRPLPGHAVCNIGDALTLFSGGILRSNLHRVVPPPSVQAAHERYSIVFFTRPGNDVLLRALADESELIKEALEKMVPEERKKFEPGATARKWFTRRNKNERTKNRTGPETWRASRGMEYKPEVI
ncbi:hypothetical protein EW145_g942 [Phellinidium pouzarii]|uniref:Fe2OG dioxygenase domain-containing protein n=1 Tax=Phellinidium pouzarii TaxID=167371 RepID=A0A4S4LGE3_9AGAM|nr:hypothetical protein EW145_g942 [Phellinidium pouzarii]